MNGDADLIAARRALLNALDALGVARDSAILVGAQAIYMHTGATTLAIAETTRDSDLAIDPRTLPDEPRLEQVMLEAEFVHDPGSPQPGAWQDPDGIPVDLMVPEALAGAKSKRGARIPPHAKDAARRAVGLEAALVDHAPMEITALEPGDDRCYTIEAAGPGALLVAKLHKIGERVADRDRLADKDAHDVYRLLAAIDTAPLAHSLEELAEDPLAGDVTRRAIELLNELFASGAGAPGSEKAGRAEQGLGNPQVAAASAAALGADVMASLPSSYRGGR